VHEEWKQISVLGLVNVIQAFGDSYTRRKMKWKICCELIWGDFEDFLKKENM
jgi:hypothetical protein